MGNFNVVAANALSFSNPNDFAGLVVAGDLDETQAALLEGALRVNGLEDLAEAKSVEEIQRLIKQNPKAVLNAMVQIQRRWELTWWPTRFARRERFQQVMAGVLGSNAISPSASAVGKTTVGLSLADSGKKLTRIGRDKPAGPAIVEDQPFSEELTSTWPGITAGLFEDHNLPGPSTISDGIAPVVEETVGGSITEIDPDGWEKFSDMPGTAQDVAAFLRSRAGPDFKVFVSSQRVPPEGVHTAMGELITIPATVRADSAWLIFIDLNPYSEWAHDCLYYFIGDAGNISEPIEARYPPTEKDVSLIDMDDPSTSPYKKK